MMPVYSCFPTASRHVRTGITAAILLAAVLILPGSLYSSLSAEETDADLAPTCAGVYSAISPNFADKNYLAMVHNYYLFSDLSEAQASESAAQRALKLSSAVNDGKLTEDDIMGAAKMCSTKFNIALPLSLNRNLVPGYVTEAQAYTATSQPAPAPVATAADRACIAADEAYTAIAQSIPGKLESAGARVQENGQLNSKYYYALGNICDSLKVAEKNIGSTCGAAEVPAKLDQCS